MKKQRQPNEVAIKTVEPENETHMQVFARLVRAGDAGMHGVPQKKQKKTH